MAEQVNDMLARSVVLELNTARLEGRLEGETSEARYLSFASRFPDREFRLDFFRAYPVLARQIVVAASQWRTTTVQVIERLAADQEHLERWQGIPPGSRELTEIIPGAGDRHRGGQTVTKLRFNDGSRVIYKPRPGRLDAAFAGLIDWVNGQSLRFDLGAVATLVREEYSWQQEAVFARCEEGESDEGVAERFYYRQGGLLALLYLLSGSDVHSENLVCVKDVPYLIDLESLCQPEMALIDVRLTSSERAIIDLTTDSVVRVGLLPSQSAMVPGGPSADISGLGGRAGQRTFLRLPSLADVGTDRMHIELDFGETEENANQPLHGDVTALLPAHVEDVAAGFTDVYRAFMRNKAWLVHDEGSPLQALRNVSTRVLARHTAYYAVIHMSSFHPDLLRDALAREAHYDFLEREAANVPALLRFVEHERSDLWNNDIPLFSSLIDSLSVHTSSGDRIEGLLTRSGIDCLQQRIGALSDSGLTQQLWLIRISVGLAAVNADSALTYPSYAPPRLTAATEATAPQTLLLEAGRIGQRLADLAFEQDGEVEWLGVNSQAGGNWSLGPLGPDLYHGLTGISVFFAALARLSADPRFERLASAGLRTAEQQVERGMLNEANGLSGLPGYLLGTAMVTALLDQPPGDRALTQATIDRLRDAIEADQDWDVSGGLAGTILCLAGLPTEMLDEQSYRSLIAAAARRLVEAQDPVSGGWISKTMAASGLATAPLAGLAHGCAGICWALTTAAHVVDDPTIAAAAARGLAYERTLYVPERGNWRDLRDERILGDTADAPLVAWCHGASGIALARTAILTDGEGSLVRREIEAAVRTTFADGVGHNHSLCHGDLGNLEMVSIAAARLDRAEWRTQKEVLLAQAVEAGRRRGWLCGMPTGVESPGLMTGAAGIGYGLLRAAFPAEVPSVLLLDSGPGSRGGWR